MNEREQILWEEAYECAYQRAREEGDVDIEYDYPIIEAWTEEYYYELLKMERMK